MIQLLFFSMSITFSFIFMQMSHPLAMGLILLIQTTLISLISGILAKTFWFSYILFLIFIGGMLVLFIYVTSLASNEMFSFSINLMFKSIFIMTILMISSLFLDKTFISTIMNNETNLINNMNSYMLENSIDLIKLYNYPTNMISLLLINYLLITLIAIVKVTNLFYGPLRTSY